MKEHPNFVRYSFQTPNQYVDDVMSYLTGEEYKVLSYAVRRILGFQKRQDHISISQFTHGVKKPDGSGNYDKGTGLCVSTVKKCLANLTNFGLMVRIARNNRNTNKGDLWALQWEVEGINLAALKARQEQKSRANASNITKARVVRQSPKKA